jgi:hypothetical protein
MIPKFARDDNRPPVDAEYDFAPVAMSFRREAVGRARTVA